MDLSHIDQSKKWLIALSCGPDSMALLYKCIEHHLTVGCAFVNYHHREQSKLEEAYARKVCDTLNVPLYVMNDPFDEGDENFEAKARTWRYNFFVDIVNKYDYAGCLIGHQEDDLLETYFMQKEKGIVPMHYGLVETGEYHGMVVKRCLLDETKHDLESYCKNNGIQYYIDHTNFDETYTRNRIRHNVVEKMDRKERDLLRKEIDEKNAMLKRIRERAKVLVCEDGCLIDAYRLELEPVRLCILRDLLEEPYCKDRLSRKFLLEIDEVVMKKKDFEIDVRQNRLVLKDGYMGVVKQVEPYAYQVDRIEDIFSLKSEHFKVIEGKPSVYSVTVSEDDLPLTIRSYQEGDRIQMRFGTKKLHRFFIDKHIPLFERRSWPVVENRHKEVILVPGIGCDVQHYSITPSFSVLQCSLYLRRENYEMELNKSIKEVLISSKEIQNRVKELGAQISNDYKDLEQPLMLVALLKGSVPFLADLTRELNLDLVYDFMDVSSYAGTESTGNVKVLKDLESDITGWNVLIVEDIIDTGNTLKAVKEMLKNRGANDVKIVTFLDKPERRTVDVKAEYVGYEIPDKFVVGYGMDCNEHYRSLPYIGIYNVEE